QMPRELGAADDQLIARRRRRRAGEHGREQQDSQSPGKQPKPSHRSSLPAAASGDDSNAARTATGHGGSRGAETIETKTLALRNHVETRLPQKHATRFHGDTNTRTGAEMPARSTRRGVTC